MIIIEPLEIRKGDVHTGKFRLTRRSDEEDIGITGLCDHEHDSLEEARECPEARQNSGIEPNAAPAHPETESLALIYVPNWQDKVCRLLGFRSEHFDWPQLNPNTTEQTDDLYVEATTSVSFVDRIRILLTGRCRTRIKVATERIIGKHATATAFEVLPPKWLVRD